MGTISFIGRGEGRCRGCCEDLEVVVALVQEAADSEFAARTLTV